MHQVSVFISSTFNDMMYERDALRRYVLPELSSYYLPKGIDVQLIDLRWGVVSESENEELIEEKILKCCIDTIDQCQPFFIGFIGHRYGWVPEQLVYNSKSEKKSITHIEIQHGVVRNNNYSRSLIFKRNKESYNSLPLQDYCKYVDNNSNNIDSLFNSLQDGYREFGEEKNIIEYSINVYNPTEEELYAFSKLIILHLKRIIDLQIGENSVNPKIHSCDLFLKNYTPPYTVLTDIIQNLSQGKNCLIYGNEGVGKTSAALWLYKNISESYSNINCFFFSPDFSLGECNKLKDAIYSWSTSICECELNPLVNIADEWNRFKILNKDQSNPAFVIIDGYNKIEDVKNSNLFLLPSSGIVYIIFSNEKLIKWENRYSLNPITINGMTRDEAINYINKVVHSNYKEIPSFIYDSILENRKFEDDTYLPMDLAVLASYILSLDHEDFDAINKDIGKSKEKALYDYIESIIEKMPKASNDRSLYIIQKVISIYGKEILQPILYIAFSLYGLTIKQLEKLIDNFKIVSFFLIRNYLRSYLPSGESNGKWIIHDTGIINSLESVLCENKSIYFYKMSLLDDLTDEEKFYYALKGYNSEVVVQIYSSINESNGQFNNHINNFLLKYFEDVNNFNWFLSSIESENYDQNEKIVSNLFYSFLIHFARQNPQLNYRRLMFTLLSFIEKNRIKLETDIRFDYLGAISEAIGYDILNKNLNRDNHKIGISHLNNALRFFELSKNDNEVAINYIKRKIEKENGKY